MQKTICLFAYEAVTNQVLMKSKVLCAWAGVEQLGEIGREAAHYTGVCPG